MAHNERIDIEALVQLVETGSRVLDLGCGDGELLERLVRDRQVVARGVEISETAVRACIARGLSVRHGNIEEGLADYSDNAFDCVVLSQTLAFLNQPAPVVREMLRVGRRALISFENAGYWVRRWQAGAGGGMGPTLLDDTPRQRAITLPQFRAFSAALGAVIEREIYLSGHRAIHVLPGWRASVSVFALRKA